MKLALTLILLSFSGLLSAAEEQIKTLEIGAKAPGFRLQGVDGRWYTLRRSK